MKWRWKHFVMRTKWDQECPAPVAESAHAVYFSVSYKSDSTSLGFLWRPNSKTTEVGTESTGLLQRCLICGHYFPVDLGERLIPLFPTMSHSYPSCNYCGAQSPILQSMLLCCAEYFEVKNAGRTPKQFLCPFPALLSPILFSPESSHRIWEPISPKESQPRKVTLLSLEGLLSRGPLPTPGMNMS
jgi:hypothetical protein